MEQERVQSLKEQINKTNKLMEAIFETLTNLQKDAVETLRKASKKKRYYATQNVLT